LVSACDFDLGDGGVDLLDDVLDRGTLRNVSVDAVLLVGDFLQFILPNVMGECCMLW